MADLWTCGSQPYHTKRQALTHTYQSGDSAEIPLVEAGKYPTEVRDKWKVVEKMELVTQYAFAGDYTGETIDHACSRDALTRREQWKLSTRLFKKWRSSTQVSPFGSHMFTACAQLPSDDWFVITITDANFGRYGITPEELKRVMTQQPKVRTALICIGEGAEAFWLVVAARMSWDLFLTI